MDSCLGQYFRHFGLSVPKHRDMLWGGAAEWIKAAGQELIAADRAQKIAASAQAAEGGLPDGPALASSG